MITINLINIISHRSTTPVVWSVGALGISDVLIMVMPHVFPVNPTLQTQVLEMHIPFELQK